MKFIFKLILLQATLLAPLKISANKGSVVQISSKVEQANLPISKTFSLRLKGIKTIRLSSSNDVKLIDLYYEDSLGNRISLKSNSEINTLNPFVKNIEKTNLKKITYTVISTLENKTPVVLNLELIKDD